MTDSKRMFLPTPIQASLLSGATQVSTPVKPQPEAFGDDDFGTFEWHWTRGDTTYRPWDDQSCSDLMMTFCPFSIGTEVWVPESWNTTPSIEWCNEHKLPWRVCYKADDSDDPPWHSPATMPSWAARLRYIIEGVKAEKQGDTWVYVYALRRL